MWIDTHNHFDFSVFDGRRETIWQKAQTLGVTAQFVMSVSPSSFKAVEDLADRFDGSYFALGIHPLFIADSDSRAMLAKLEAAIALARRHPRFVGVGEIGLDGTAGNMPRQIEIFTAQLRLASDYDLPVFMHVRKAQDSVVKYCRQFAVKRGIAHAFNGSLQQADNYMRQGFKLGVGGMLTFTRAKKIRRLVKELPLEAFVVETDAPDMSPCWAYQQTNYSYYLPKIAEVFADLRGISRTSLSKQLHHNTQAVLANHLQLVTVCNK